MPINATGLITAGTRRNLIQGLRARPMLETAVDAALRQAVNFSEQLVTTYEEQIAAGEVGSNGSARASADPILGTRAPTVLMYGRVQSGKTAGMILTSALCMDNGFRIVVVLTANNVALVTQTANRFKALNGPRVFSSVKKDDTYEWEGQEGQLREDIATDGLVLVCAKDAFHLPQIILFLQQMQAPSYPAIVLDDEADAATPDTTLAARSSGRPNAPAHPSTINRRIIENQMPGQEGESISEILPHSLYVQVTATPYVLFLQRANSRIRPTITFLLEPGEGYCGGEVFFGTFDPSSSQLPVPPLVFLPANEARAINLLPVPTGLANSIEFFLLATAARARHNGWPDGGFKHLAHPSHRINQHAVVAGHIERHLNDLRRQLRDAPEEAQERFAGAYAELRKTVANAPSLNELLADLPDVIRQREIVTVNSETGAPAYGPRINFLIGGNILGRGLTIDDLLVTYYLREAQISQMDTIWQHARMYGYRQSLMPYTRVYLPQRAAIRLKGVHEAEEELRALLQREAEGSEVLLRIATGTRATRPNALEPQALDVIGPGLDQVFPWYLQQDQTEAMRIREILLGAGVSITIEERDRRATPIPLETAYNLINAIPVRDGDPGKWNITTISALMESYKEQYNGQATVYVRGLQDEPLPSGGWPRGRLSGDEIRIIRQAANGLPALALMYYGGNETPQGWYPTLVMPANAPAYIINPL